MYCSKCGAAVIGKFCSCCGTRVRNRIEEFRLAEKRAEKAFKDACTYDSDRRLLGLDRMHLAMACWQAASIKYGTYRRLAVDNNVPDAAFDELQIIRMHAEKLFDQLVSF